MWVLCSLSLVAYRNEDGMAWSLQFTAHFSCAGAHTRERFSLENVLLILPELVLVTFRTSPEHSLSNPLKKARIKWKLKNVKTNFHKNMLSVFQWNENKVVLPLATYVILRCLSTRSYEGY